MSLADELAVHNRLPDRCPQCGAEALIPIAYGYPTRELEAAAARGEVEHRGCLVGEGAPLWCCQACHAEGGHLRLQARR